jgi:dihydroxyacetone kinase DhaKLM complex PTS-EIIA-like component DhaM
VADVIGLLIVSHTARLAEGVCELAGQAAHLAFGLANVGLRGAASAVAGKGFAAGRS